jgi:hypothetical protein
MQLHGFAAISSVISLALAACYEPRYGECVVRCTATSECAPNQICGSDGWCASAGVLGRCFQPVSDGAHPVDTGAPPIDARVPPIDARVPPDTQVDAGPPVDSTPPIDSGMPDAAEPDCGADCPGMCQHGVCVIACSGPGSCEDDVICPASTPCRVECTGRESCEGTIFCGSGRCTVTCAGTRSCKRGTQCAGSCACDVVCTGDDSCRHKSICPADLCRAGQGCTSQPSSCSGC